MALLALLALEIWKIWVQSAKSAKSAKKFFNQNRVYLRKFRKNQFSKLAFIRSEICWNVLSFWNFSKKSFLKKVFPYVTFRF